MAEARKPHPMHVYFGAPEGRLFQCFPGAEERPGQHEMATLVWEAAKAGEAVFRD